MVKRGNEPNETLGRVRDTDLTPVTPAPPIEADECDERHEGFYKPEMGTVIVYDAPAPTTDR